MTPALTRLNDWRDSYRSAREAAIGRYRARPRISPLLRDLTRAADHLLQTIWQHHDLPTAAALIAVGGYGRGEQFPQSDIDLLILVDDTLPEADLARFEPLIGLFWDCGLPVGHSIRRLSECLEESAKDITIQTNLLEARPLCGDGDLAAKLITHLATAMDPAAFLAGKRMEQSDRHGRFSDRGLMLEPNLKDSPGGLRDLHMIDWVGQAAGLARQGPDTLTAMVTDGLLSRNEMRHIRAHRNFLSHLRIRLHLATGRREERLLFEFQERIAAEMGLTASRSRRASEILMQRFFRTAHAVVMANQILLGDLAQVVVTQTINGEAHPNHYDLPESTDFERHPEAILASILHLQNHPELTGFSPRALRLLARAGAHMDAAYRRNPLHQSQFIAILRQPRGVTQALRLMHRLGLIGRYIPAFARITGQMQHDLYHIHPVDEHSLMLLRNLRRLALTELAHEFPLAHRIMQDFDAPDLLYLAALFHDIAKGRGGDHSALGAIEMQRFCRHHALSAESTELLVWLVREHLTLSSTAQKQDLSDPEVIAAFAARCGDMRHLNALYLFTLCDIRATNPAIWNAWKENLLKTLYYATRNHLEGHAIVADSVDERREQARTLLRLHGWSDNAEAALWSRLDDIWFLRNTAQEIAWQTRTLLENLRNNPETLVRTRLSPIGEGVDVLVYTPDRHGLFALICGFVAHLGYSVLEARIHTTRDGHALDTFLIMDPAHTHATYRDLLGYIEHELTECIVTAHEPTHIPGRLTRQLRAFPLTPQLSLTRSEGRPDYVLSFSAGDRPGLLHAVARTLADHHVEVRTARIHTLGGRAEDVFVLEGASLENAEQRLALERALLQKLQVT